MKIQVHFKDGRAVTFDVNGWGFSDVGNNNVLLMKDGHALVHLNWSEVLFAEKVTE